MTDPDVRMIETTGVPERYARGWHCLGLAREFADGKTHTLHAFGQKLVIWADTLGDIHVLDAYCRHMGGDLSQGTVKGDDVACPFHDWRWAGNGKCTSIPYSKRVPLRARTATWPTMVHDGVLFVWNDPEGNPPIPEQMIPAIGSADDDDWTDWYWYKFKIEGSNVRELIDNVVDMAHFFYVHMTLPVYFKNVFEGHEAWQWMNSAPRPDINPHAQNPDEESGTSVAAYFGPAFMINWLTSKMDDNTINMTLINSHYPIDQNNFMLNYAIKVKKSDFPTPEIAQTSGQGMAEFIKLGFEQDVQIWANKARIDNPLLCEEDGPVYQLRRWYEQFYVDVADITEDMTARFEFEIDTTRPVENWRAEALENVRRQQGASQPV